MGFGWMEIMILLGIVLLIFGPQRLPQLARSIGKSFGIIKQEVDDVTQPLEETGKSLEEDVVGVEEEIEKTVEE